MGQIFLPDNIPLLVEASNTSLTLATTYLGSPTRITVGGQQYKIGSTLTLNTGTSGFGGIDTGSIAANTRYYVYVVVSSGAVGLVASLADTLVGPSGFTSWTKLGSFKTESGNTNIFVVFGSTNQGVFIGSMSGGFSANPADIDYYYTRIGNMVVIQTSGVHVGTSNATTNPSVSGVPADILPSLTTVQCTTMVRDNSVYQIGFANLSSAGVLSLSKTNVSGSFTNANSKGLGNNCSMVFYLQD